jgi:hypothetical protein
MGSGEGLTNEGASMQGGPFAGSPRIAMVLVGPVIGVLSGIVIGLFAMVAGKLMGPRLAAPPVAGD